jgi:folate-binding Fe-S cluster repair protein YgfZ
MAYYNKKEYKKEKKKLIKMWGWVHEEDAWLMNETIYDAFDLLREELIKKYLSKYKVRYIVTIYDYEEEKESIVGIDWEYKNEELKNEIFRNVVKEERGIPWIEIIDYKKI